MMDITTLTLPEEFYKVRQGSFRLEPVQSIFQSKFVPQGVRFGGARFLRWVCDVELAVAKRETWQRFEAFIAQCADKPYAFTLYDAAKTDPLGGGAGYDANGTAQHWQDPDLSEQHWDDGHWVDGSTFALVRDKANRYANSIVLKGLPANSLILKKGDNFSVGGNLYLAIGDSYSDADGYCRITFLWRLHKVAMPNDIVEFIKPPGRFMLFDPKSGDVMKSVAGLGTYSLQAAEVPYT